MVEYFIRFNNTMDGQMFHSVETNANKRPFLAFILPLAPLPLPALPPSLSRFLSLYSFFIFRKVLLMSVEWLDDDDEDGLPAHQTEPETSDIDGANSIPIYGKPSNANRITE